MPDLLTSARLLQQQTAIQLQPTAPRGDSTALERLAAFNTTRARVEAETVRIDGERRARMAEAGASFGERSRYTAWEFPVAGASCPPAGPLTYVWRDLYAAAARNLDALAAAPPDLSVARASDVMHWAKLVNWNIALLLNATNVRGQFLFPRSTIAAPQVGTLGPLANRRLSTSETQSYQFAAGDTRLGLDRTAFRMPQELVEREGPYNPSTLPAGFVRASITFGVPGPIEMGEMWNPPQFGSGFAPYVLLDQGWDGRPVPASLNIVDQPVQSAWPYGVMSFFDGETTANTTPLALLVKWQRTRATVTYGFTRRQGNGSESAPEGGGWNPPAWLDDLVRVARAYSRADVDQVLIDALGFYVWNHLPHWRGRGIEVIDPTLLAAMQRAAVARNMRGNTIIQATSGLTSLAAGAAGGAIGGAVSSALSQIGQELFVTLIAGALALPEGPTSLFLRVARGCVPTTTATQVDAAIAAFQADAAQRAPAAPQQIDPSWVANNVGSAGRIPTTKLIAGIGIAALAVGGLVALFRR